MLKNKNNYFEVPGTLAATTADARTTTTLLILYYTIVDTTVVPHCHIHHAYAAKKFKAQFHVNTVRT